MVNRCEIAYQHSAGQSDFTGLGVYPMRSLRAEHQTVHTRFRLPESRGLGGDVKRFAVGRYGNPPAANLCRSECAFDNIYHGWAE